MIKMHQNKVYEIIGKLVVHGSWTISSREGNVIGINHRGFMTEGYPYNWKFSVNIYEDYYVDDLWDIDPIEKHCITGIDNLMKFLSEKI